MATAQMSIAWPELLIAQIADAVAAHSDGQGRPGVKLRATGWPRAA
jgi:hypothetical protein